VRFGLIVLENVTTKGSVRHRQNRTIEDVSHSPYSFYEHVTGLPATLCIPGLC